MNKYSTGGHTLFHARYHIVWITKYRHKVLTKEIKLRIREITRQICNQLEVKSHLPPVKLEVCL
jgi:putative transposase